MGARRDFTRGWRRIIYPTSTSPRLDACVEGRRTRRRSRDWLIRRILSCVPSGSIDVGAAGRAVRGVARGWWRGGDGEIDDETARFCQG